MTLQLKKSCWLCLAGRRRCGIHIYTHIFYVHSNIHEPCILWYLHYCMCNKTFFFSPLASVHHRARQYHSACTVTPLCIAAALNRMDKGSRRRLCCFVGSLTTLVLLAFLLPASRPGPVFRVAFIGNVRKKLAYHLCVSLPFARTNPLISVPSKLYFSDVVSSICE